MINNFEHIINMCGKRYQWFNLCVNPVKGDCVCDIVENLIMQNYIAKYNIRRFTLLYPHWDVRDFFYAGIAHRLVRGLAKAERSVRF